MTTTPRRRPDCTRGRRDGGLPPLPLRVAIEMALDSLADLRRLDRHLDRRLEALLRVSLAAYRAAGTRHRVIPDPGIAVQTACAHLAVGEREDAYLALRDAQDALRRPGSRRP